MTESAKMNDYLTDYLERRKKREEEEKKKQAEAVTAEKARVSNLGRRYFDRHKDSLVSGFENDFKSYQDAVSGLYNDFNSRFYDENGTYRDTYRGDTEDWFKSYGEKSSAAEGAGKRITDFLDAYGDMLNKDSVTKVRSYLRDTSSGLSSMRKTAENDRDYWSKWATEDEYKKAISDAEKSAAYYERAKTVDLGELDEQIRNAANFDYDRQSQKLGFYKEALDYFKTNGVGDGRIPDWGLKAKEYDPDNSARQEVQKEIYGYLNPDEGFSGSDAVYSGEKMTWDEFKARRNSGMDVSVNDVYITGYFPSLVASGLSEAEYARLKGENRTAPVTEENRDALKYLEEKIGEIEGYESAGDLRLLKRQAQYLQTIAKYTAMPDFAEYSQREISGGGRRRTGEDPLGAFFEATEQEKTDALREYQAGLTLSDKKAESRKNAIAGGVTGYYDNLTDEDRAVYYYILHTEGTEKAEEYLKSLETILGLREQEKERERLKDASGWELAGYNLGSLFLKFANAEGLAEDIESMFIGTEVNPYSYAHRYTNLADNIRSETSSRIDNDVLNFMYNNGMSIADNVIRLPMGHLGLPLMATQVFETSVKKGYERGLSNGQIMQTALAESINEVLFEKMSLDRLLKAKDLKSVKEVFIDALKQGGVEASEEAFTSIANNFADAWINGGDSEYNANVRKLLAENPGMSVNDARDKALGGVVKDIALDAAGGLISGGLMGSVGGAKNYVNTIKSNVDPYLTGGKLDEGKVDTLKEYAGAISENPGALSGKVSLEAMSELSKALGELGNKTSKGNVARLNIAYNNVLTSAYESSLNAALESSSFAGTFGNAEVREIANAVTEGASFDRIAEQYADRLGGRSEEFTGLLKEANDEVKETVNASFDEYGKAHPDSMFGEVKKTAPAEETSGQTEENGEEPSVTESDTVEPVSEAVRTASSVLTDSDEIEYSTNGKTLLKTNRGVVEARIIDVVSNENGKMTVKVEAGGETRTVPLSSVSLGSESMAVVYSGMQTIGMTPASVKETVSLYTDPTGDKVTEADQTAHAQKWVVDARGLYEAGVVGYRTDFSKYDTMSEQTAKIIYNRGRIDAEARTNDAQEKSGKGETNKNSEETQRKDINNTQAEKYSKKLDSWDKQTTGFSFVLGMPSDALALKGLPNLLNNPVIVIDSKQKENARIVMGDLYDENGKVVTAVLLLTPTNEKGTTLDIIKVSSAQGRGHIESLFRYKDGTPVTVRYTDDKRISEWLSVNRLQLPLPSSVANPSDNSIPKKGGKVNPSDKKVTYRDGIDPKSKKLNDMQRAGIAAAEFINGVSSLKVVVYESHYLLGGNGERVYTDDVGKVHKTLPNGFFRNGNEIWIDINAGNGYQGAMLFTLSHELSHFSREWSPAKWKQMADYLIENFVSEEGTVEEILAAEKEKVRAEIKESGEKGVSESEIFDRAYEELVSDALETIMTKQAAYDQILAKIREINKSDPSFGQKLKQFFKNIIEKIRAFLKAYDGATPETYAGRAVANFPQEVYDKLVELYTDAFADAERNYRENGGKNESAGGRKNSYGGRLAKTANVGTLETAEALEKEGADPEEIRKRTGWFKGMDGKWRFEIDDSGMSIDFTGKNSRNPDVRRFAELDNKAILGTLTEEEQTEARVLAENLKGVKKTPSRLGDIVSGSELFEAYPQLEDVKVTIKELGDKELGHFDPKTNTIALDTDFIDAKQRNETLIHEIQHAIQYIEGFASGASVDYWSEQRREISDTISSARKNLDLWLKDIGYDDYVKKSMQEVVEKKKSLDQHWRDIAKFKANSKYAKEIAASESELEEYQRRYNEITNGMTAYEQYQNTAGEIEARDVQRRLDYDEDKRRATRPDVDRKDVVFAEENGVSYSISPNAKNEVHKAVTDISVRDEISLTDNTPSIISSQKGAKNLPMMMNASHVRQNILTADEARQLGIVVDKSQEDHWHGLGEDLFLKVIDGLDDVELAYRGTKTATDPSRRENYFLLISKITDASGNTINVPVYINEKGQYNRVFIDINKVATVFGRNNFNEYISNQLKKGELVRIKNRSKSASERTAPIAAGYNASASDNSIPNSDENVNTSGQKNSRRNPYDVFSSRALLANAPESSAKTDVEKKKLAEYKAKVAEVAETERQLDTVTAELAPLMFAKGKRDTARINELKEQKKKLLNALDIYNNQLTRLESGPALDSVYAREKAKLTAKQRAQLKDAVLAERERQNRYYRERVDEYRDARKKAVEGRKVTELRNRIIRIVNELDNMILHPTKTSHIPTALQGIVVEALELINTQLDVKAENSLKRAELRLSEETLDDDIARLRRSLERAEDLVKRRVDIRTAYAEIDRNGIRDELEYLIDWVNKKSQSVDKEGTEEGAKEKAERFRSVAGTASNLLSRLGEVEQKMRQVSIKELRQMVINLKSAYEDVKKDKDSNGVYDENVLNQIDAVKDIVDKTPLSEMTSAQLEEVHDMFAAIKTMVSRANRTFKAGKENTISGCSEQIIREIGEQGKDRSKMNSVHKLLRNFGYMNLKPETFFHIMGSDTLNEFFDELMKAEEKYAVNVNNGVEFKNKISEKYGYNSWDFEKQQRFRNSEGLNFDLTLGQIMSLYAYSKRAQADEHLSVGGFNPGKVIVKEKKGLVKYEINDTTTYRMTKEDVRNFTDTLTAEQKAFVDDMQRYLSEDMAKLGNEVFLEMYGYKMFKEKFYFPLKTSKYWHEFNPETDGGMKQITNGSFTKALKPDATSPIVLDDFLNVWGDHVEKMSTYNAFSRAVDDLTKVYNYSSVSTLGTTSVEAAMTKAHSEAATKYIEALLKDINGGGQTDQAALSGTVGRFKKAAVFANLSVIIQQPTSFPRAFVYIPARYFLTLPKMSSKTWNECKEYCPIAIMKEMGSMDIGTGRTARELLSEGKKSFWDKIEDATGKGAEIADRITWCYMWEAAKNMAAHELKASRNSEEVKKRASEIFTKAMRATQVYDSTLSRSGMMRSKNSLNQMASAFMSEPTTMLNMAVEAALQGKKGNMRFAGNTLRAILISTLLNDALKALVSALRDKDEDQSYFEKWLEHLTSDLLSDANPANYLPYVKDVWSIAQGYDVARTDMSVFEGIVDRILKATKSGKVEDYITMGAEITKLTGIPVNNFARDVSSIIRTVKQTIENNEKGYGTTSSGVKRALISGVNGALPIFFQIDEDDKSKQIYDALVNGDEEQLRRFREGYASDSTYSTAVRKALRDHDSRIYAAAMADIDKNVNERVRITREIESEKHFSLDDVIRAINTERTEVEKAIREGNADKLVDRGYDADWVSGKIAGYVPPETEDSPELISSYYKKDDLNNALEAGDYDTFKNVYMDLLDTAKKNGKTKKDFKTSVKSTVTSYWKPLYREAAGLDKDGKRVREQDSGRMREIRQLLYQTGLYDDVSKTCQGWLK